MGGPGQLLLLLLPLLLLQLPLLSLLLWIVLAGVQHKVDATAAPAPAPVTAHTSAGDVILYGWQHV